MGSESSQDSARKASLRAGPTPSPVPFPVGLFLCLLLLAMPLGGSPQNSVELAGPDLHYTGGHYHPNNLTYPLREERGQK